MGIVRFRRFLRKRVEPKRPNLFSRPMGNNSVLAFDANGLFHEEAQKFYGYGEYADRGAALEARFEALAGEGEEKLKTYQETLLLEYIDNLKKRIREWINMIRPTEYLLFHVDGVPPLAKIYQQEQRQFRGSNDPPTTRFFDNAVIKPGTEWMSRVCDALQAWMSSPDIGVKSVIASFHLTPGEGEHKILNNLREIELADQGNIILVGQDADLNILSLLSKQVHIYVALSMRRFINVDELRAYLLENGAFVNGKPQTDETLIRDFAVLSFLIGNDFLPHMFLFRDIEDSLSFLFLTCYRNLGLELTEDNDQGYIQINWKNMHRFLEYLNSQEEYFLHQIFDKLPEYKHPLTIMQDSIDEEEDYDPEKFRDLWYKRIFQPRTTFGRRILRKTDAADDLEENIESLCHHYLYGLQWVLNYYTSSKYNLNYSYNELYAPLIEDLVRYPTEVSLSDVQEPTTVSYKAAPPKVVFKLAGESDREFAKRRERTTAQREAFFEDAKQHNKTARKANKPLNVYQHMLCITTQRSMQYAPQPVQDLLRGDLDFLCPSKIKLELEGVNEDWESVAVVNPINFDMIREHLPRVPAQYQDPGPVTFYRSSSASYPVNRGRGRGRGRGGSREVTRPAPEQEKVPPRAERGRGAPRGASRGAARGAPRGRGTFRGRGK